jgi:hypothetical protein
MPGSGKEEKAPGMKIIVSPFLWFLFFQGGRPVFIIAMGFNGTQSHFDPVIAGVGLPFSDNIYSADQ